MKAIFTLTLLVITSFISRAAINEARITITNLGFSDVLIEIDGKRYDNGHKTISIPDFPWGIYKLRIVRLPGRKQAGEAGAAVIPEKELYNNTINIKPRSHVDIVINRFDKVMVDELSINDQEYRNDTATQYSDSADNRYNDRMIYEDMGYYYGGDKWPLSRSAFRTLQELMGSEPSGTKRLTLAKEVIDQNYVTAMQVKLLADLFTNDERALELVQYAYPKTVNKNEFFVVYGSFMRNSNREKLAAFIKNYKENSEPVNK